MSPVFILAFLMAYGFCSGYVGYRLHCDLKTLCRKCSNNCSHLCGAPHEFAAGLLAMFWPIVWPVRMGLLLARDSKALHKGR